MLSLSPQGLTYDAVQAACVGFVYGDSASGQVDAFTKSANHANLSMSRERYTTSA